MKHPKAAFFLNASLFSALAYYKFVVQEKKDLIKQPQVTKAAVHAPEQSLYYYKLKTRQQHLDEITQKNNSYDVVIIGGGCSGAGVFLEGANRGLKCAVLEANDFAAATSSKSTKLIHGGIRYLQEVFEVIPLCSSVRSCERKE